MKYYAGLPLGILSVLSIRATEPRGRLEAYIRATYLKPDPGYRFSPSNRFRALGGADTRQLLDWSRQGTEYASMGNRRYVWSLGESPAILRNPGSEFDEALQVIAKCAPSLAAIKEELFPDETVSFSGGRAITFFLDRLDDRRDYSVRTFFSSIALELDNTCSWLEDRPTRIYLEKEWHTRQLWDIFDWGDRRVALLFDNAGEAYFFEACAIRPQKLEKLTRFRFGCAGCP